MNICILIPVYNEAKFIAPVVAALKKKDFLVIVIDDGSSDDSALIAQKNGAEVIRNPKNQGKGASLRTGFREAIQRGCDGVIIMDGDGQHDPNDVEHFLRRASENKDSIVNGNRMVNAHSMPLLRQWTNRFMSSLISSVCKQHIPDTQCGFRYIGKKVLQNIEFTCEDFEIETEILIKAAKKGYPIYSTSIKTIYGSEESKINPIKDTFRFIKYFLREITGK